MRIGARLLRETIGRLLPSQEEYGRTIAGCLVRVHVDTGFVDMAPITEVYVAPKTSDEFIRGLVKVIYGMVRSNPYPLDLVVFGREMTFHGKSGEGKIRALVIVDSLRVMGMLR